MRRRPVEEADRREGRMDCGDKEMQVLEIEQEQHMKPDTHGEQAFLAVGQSLDCQPGSEAEERGEKQESEEPQIKCGIERVTCGEEQQIPDPSM